MGLPGQILIPIPRPRFYHTITRKLRRRPALRLSLVRPRPRDFLAQSHHLEHSRSSGYSERLR